MIEHDPVNKPAHYTFGSIEVIDFIDGLGIGYWFSMGNAIKYIARADHKGNRLQDLKKARFYTNHMLDLTEGSPEFIRPATNKKFIPVEEAVKDWSLPIPLRVAMWNLVAGGRMCLRTALSYLDQEIGRAEVEACGVS